MALSEKTDVVFDIKAVVISLIAGVALYIILCFSFAIVIRNGLVPYEFRGIISKGALLISVLVACSVASRRGRGEAFLNSICCAVTMFSAGIHCSFIFDDKEWDTVGTVICLLLCVLSCFLAVLQKEQNSNLHKRRKKIKR